MEVNPADVAGVRIRYKLGTAEFSIALSARTSCCCSTPAGVRHPVQAAGVGALPPPHGQVGGENAVLGEPVGVGVGGVFGRGHPAVQLWGKPPHPGQPPQRLSSKARPRPETQTPYRAPPPPPPNPRNPKSPPHRSASPSNRAAARRRTRHSPVPMGRARGSNGSKSGARSPPLWRGMSHLTPCLVSRCMCPTPMVSTRGL